MNKDNENKLVPKLRFPDFKNEGMWEEIKLKQSGNFYRGLTYGAGDTNNEGLLVLRSGNIQNDRLVLDNDLVFVNKDCPKDLRLIEGDIVICMSNGSKPLVGKNAEYKGGYSGEITVGAFCSILRPKNRFTKYLLQTDYYQKFIALSIGGGNINNLKNSDLEEFKCLAPKNIEEQQKISACLSSVDEVITAERQKLEVLKEHKKGLLQNLFPQEGETVPKVRFKEFEESGEWEVRSVEGNIDLISGIALKSEELSDDKSGTPILRGVNITEGEIRHSDEMDKFYLGEIENIEKYLVEENDIVIGMDGSKVGKNVAIVSSKDAGSILIQRVARIRAINSDIKYLYQHFLSNNFRNYVDVVNTSSGIPHISAKQIRDFKIGFPPSIEEQHKIADTLSSIDELIIAQGQKLEAQQLHKKGLLQGLFPNLNEVTE